MVPMSLMFNVIAWALAQPRVLSTSGTNYQFRIRIIVSLLVTFLAVAVVRSFEAYWSFSSSFLLLFLRNYVHRINNINCWCLLLMILFLLSYSSKDCMISLFFWCQMIGVTVIYLFVWEIWNLLLL